jgi:hypothetical protein
MTSLRRKSAGNIGGSFQPNAAMLWIVETRHRNQHTGPIVCYGVTDELRGGFSRPGVGWQTRGSINEPTRSAR